MPISAAEPLLDITGLSAGYGKIGVLHGVDLSVGASEVVALLGPNSVVLPAPFGPSSATTSPALTFRSTPCSTPILP